MKSLSLVSSSSSTFSNYFSNSRHDGAQVSATTLDLETYTAYTTAETVNQDADVEIELWKLTLETDGNDLQGSTPLLMATFTSTAGGLSQLSEHSSALSPPSPNQVVSLHVNSDTRRLVLVLQGGDIAAVSLDEDENAAKFEVEGSVDSGIHGACWSPDDSLLVLVTGDGKVLLMTSTFDVLSEHPLHSTRFGADAPINLNWGSVQTQFHGSAGKAAASASTSAPAVGSSPDDDRRPRVSWRGDGALFVVSSLSPTTDSSEPRYRILRVYDRTGELQSTAEKVPGLEHVLSWKPAGDLIASTQRFGGPGLGQGKEGRHDVVFFERNGLRHGEFQLRETIRGSKVYRVRELAWNADSTVLAIWIERTDGDVVQLWTTGNYHWYLKHEFSASRSGRFTSIVWHPEQPLHLVATTRSSVMQRIFAWETFTDRRRGNSVETGSVAVLDGDRVLLTPFRMQNVPPPMSSSQLQLERPAESAVSVPIHLSFSPSGDLLAILHETGNIQVWKLNTHLATGRGKVMDPTLFWAGSVAGREHASCKWRQILLRSDGTSEDDTLVFVLGDDGKSEHLGVARVSQQQASDALRLPGRNGRLVESGDADCGVFWQSAVGEVYSVDVPSNKTRFVSKFAQYCSSCQHILVDRSHARTLFVGLAPSGRLFVAGGSGASIPSGDAGDPAAVSETISCVIANNVGSFAVVSNHVVYTVSTHEAVFAPISSLVSLLVPGPDGVDTAKVEALSKEWERRRIERGARIVTAVASTMSLVLQMPRGNLETISPRPLVLEVVKQDLDAGEYRKAFLACRKHRIDMNILVEHNKGRFVKDLARLIDQVDDVDHMNLFLASIGRGSLPKDTVTTLCTSIGDELERRDLRRWINSVLTAYVVKSPPDHEGGLATLLRLRESSPNLVEDAVKYIIFLVDANTLFDTALGMYDFELVLMIAQHAQKDPREYLPFLRGLRALDKYYQRFKIDDHLKRHAKALRNLSLAGPERFEEAMAYIERHQLHSEALSIWKGTDSYPTVLGLYGEWLFERREFRQAASVFVAAEQYQKAMIAHEKALEWQGLFDLACRQKVGDDDIAAMAYRVAEDLSSKKRHAEAGRVLLDYAKDVREAVVAFTSGNHFSEARRVISLHSQEALLEDVVYPAALESCTQITEDISEMREQLRKQVHRLGELRVKRTEEPDAFFGVDDPNLHNVDVMTDASMPATQFTRYTVAPTSASRTSKKSSKTKRKMERKLGSGRKGTVDEEEYLLKSLGKLVARYNTTQGETASLLPHLLSFSAEHRDAGLALQDLVAGFSSELGEALDGIWKSAPSASDGDVAAGDGGWAKRMQDAERARLVDPIERVARPEVDAGEWRMRLLER